MSRLFTNAACHYFLSLGRWFICRVPVEIEEVAQLATLVDGFGSLGFGQVLSAASVDLQCWRMFSFTTCNVC